MVAVRAEGEEEEGEEGGSSSGSVARGNFLHADGIAPRPAHLVFGLAVRVDAVSFCKPVEPTTRMPRWQFLHRKIFCNVPPRLTCSARRSLGTQPFFAVERTRSSESGR